MCMVKTRFYIITLLKISNGFKNLYRRITPLKSFKTNIEISIKLASCLEVLYYHYSYVMSGT